jgi:hypothetical protein
MEVFCLQRWRLMLQMMMNDRAIMNEMNKEIITYNGKQAFGDKEICDQLATIILNELTDAENKIGIPTLFGFWTATQ